MTLKGMYGTSVTPGIFRGSLPNSCRSSSEVRPPLFQSIMAARMRAALLSAPAGVLSKSPPESVDPGEEAGTGDAGPELASAASVPDAAAEESAPQ